jgi:hypothetical protein
LQSRDRDRADQNKSKNWTAKAEGEQNHQIVEDGRKDFVDIHEERGLEEMRCRRPVERPTDPWEMTAHPEREGRVFEGEEHDGLEEYAKDLDATRVDVDRDVRGDESGAALITVGEGREDLGHGHRPVRRQDALFGSCHEVDDMDLADRVQIRGGDGAGFNQDPLVRETRKEKETKSEVKREGRGSLLTW